MRVAEYQRSLAAVRAPVDGKVVRVARVGDVLVPGATVAEIREAAPPRVTTWLRRGAGARSRVGTEAEVRADWFPARSGRGPSGTRHRHQHAAEYPPTSFATSDIHLTRAVRVEITLSETAEQPALPPGTPVDVRFLGK